MSYKFNPFTGTFDLVNPAVASPLGVTSGGTGTTTQFTPGSVVFAGTNGVYTQDNANLFWDDTNNRLGIGTASPVTPLNVVGVIQATGLIRSTGGTATGATGPGVEIQYATGLDYGGFTCYDRTAAAYKSLHADALNLFYTLNGNVTPSLYITTASSLFNAYSSSAIGLVVKGASSQSANLLELQDSSANIYSSFNINQTVTYSVSVAGPVLAINSNSTSKTSSILLTNPANAAGGSGQFLYFITGSGNGSAGNDAYIWQTSPNSGFGSFTTKTAAGAEIGGWFISRATGYFSVGSVIGTTSQLFVTPLNTTTIGQVIKGVASQSANLQEWQNSSGTPYVTVGPPTLADSLTSNFFNITATMPTTNTTGKYGIYYGITSAGSADAYNIGLRVDYLAGYTGAGSTAAINFINTVAGTGNGYATATVGFRPSGNQGVIGFAYGTTTGNNSALVGAAANGNENFGTFSSATIDKASANNVGVAGFALNGGASGIQIAGYFGLQAAIPTFTSAALMADNGATTSSIFVARDNGTAVFTIADGGPVTATSTISSTGYQISGAATSRKMLVGNGTSFVASTETWAVPGTSGNVLTSDGTNWTSAAASGGSGLTTVGNVTSGSVAFDGTAGTTLTGTTAGITLTAQAQGAGNNTTGATMTLSSGAGGSLSTGGAGGPLNITSGAGNGSNAKSGGKISITSGASSATGNGGIIALLTANGGATSGNGGALQLTAGDGGAVGNGGAFSFTTGYGGNTSGNGGGITIAGGDSTTLGTPGAIAINGGAAAGSDQAGADFTISTPRGTGSTTVNKFYLKCPKAGTGSGTTVHTSVNRIIVNGSVTNLATGVASTIATVACASNSSAGGHVVYTIEESDGTDFIAASGQCAFSIVNKSGSTTGVTSVLGTEAQAKSDGTDTIANTWAFSGTSLQLTSTIVGNTPSVFRITYTIVSNSPQAVTVP